MIGISLYFVVLTRDTTSVPIKSSANLTNPMEENEMRGSEVHVNTYDLDGNLTSSGKSKSVLLVGEDQLSLKDGLEYHFNQNGKKYHTRADSFENLPNGKRRLSAEPGKKIFLAIEDGISIETEGPLVYDENHVISTKAAATFKMGGIQGRCTGLKYKPEAYLELVSKARFTATSPEGQTHINAEFLKLDYQTSKGVIRQGIIRNTPVNAVHTHTLEAETFDIGFRGNPNSELILADAKLQGEPTRVSWEEGELTSPVLEVCFDETGTNLTDVQTGKDAVYTSISADGSLMVGRTGQLMLLFQNGSPHQLKSGSAIALTVTQQDNPPLELTGQKGLESQFEDSRIRSTRLFGSPSFQYGSQLGQAGTLRVLHDERKVLLGQTARLRDEAQNLTIRGDEILLAQWNQEQQEVFANRFVEISYAENTPEVLKSWGDTLTLTMPSKRAILTGTPARLEQNQQVVEAQNIDILQRGPHLYELKTDDQVNLTLQSEQGPLKIVAQNMFFSQEHERVTFQEVAKAELGLHGTLTCKNLRLFIPQKATGRKVERIEAKGQVLYDGLLKDGDTTKAFRTRSDELLFDEKAQTIVFSGKQKDVLVNHPDGELKGRKLTYDLIDGSMRVDSATHGVTQTTVKLNDQQKQKLR